MTETPPAEIEKRLLFAAGQVPALLAAIGAIIETHPEPAKFLQAFEKLESGMRAMYDDLAQPALQLGLEQTCTMIRALAGPHHLVD